MPSIQTKGLTMALFLLVVPFTAATSVGDTPIAEPDSSRSKISLDCLSEFSLAVGEKIDAWRNIDAIRGCNPADVSINCSDLVAVTACVMDWCSSLANNGDGCSVEAYLVDCITSGGNLVSFGFIIHCTNLRDVTIECGSSNEECISLDLIRDGPRTLAEVTRCISGLVLDDVVDEAGRQVPDEVRDEIAPYITMRLPSLCASVYGSVSEVEASKCGGTQPPGQVCGFNDNGGGGSSSHYAGDAKIAETTALAISGNSADCAWDSIPSGIGGSCSTPFDPHYHWHTAAGMSSEHKVGGVAYDYPAGPGFYEFAMRTAAVEMTYNDAGPISVGT